VLGRKDIGTSYHLASVLDDAETGVTHVIRGEDLRQAAGLHALLHALFGLQPPIYGHHRLLLNDDGQRLSKRNKSATLRAMREAGATAEDILAQLKALSVSP
jgi:glutamyl-Q tRNA(Asp) synthetase